MKTLTHLTLSIGLKCVTNNDLIGNRYRIKREKKCQNWEVFGSLRLGVQCNATPSHDNFPLFKSRANKRACTKRRALCIINGHWIIRYAVSSIFIHELKLFPNDVEVNDVFESRGSTRLIDVGLGDELWCWFAILNFKD